MYGPLMLGAAMMVRIPKEGYLPEGYTPPAVDPGTSVQSLDGSDVLRTKQFYLLWAAMFGPLLMS